MAGWIKLHRSITDCVQFCNPIDFKIWVWLLCRASHADKNTSLKIGRGVTTVKLKRGQLIFGRNKAEAALNIDGSTIYKCIQKMASEKSILIESNNQYSIITICNYQEYQASDDDEVFEFDEIVTTKEQPSNNQVTTKEQQSNSRVTAGEQPSNSSVTQLKNSKNKENNKKRETKKAVPVPLPEPIQKTEADPPPQTPPPEKKKPAAKKEKKEDVTEFWDKLVKVWYSFNMDHKKIRPTFGHPEGKALKGIIKNLKERALEAGHVWTEIKATGTLIKFLEHAIKVNWLKDNFLLPNIHKQFDKIISDATGTNNTQQQQQPIKGHQPISGVSMFEKFKRLNDANIDIGK